MEKLAPTAHTWHVPFRRMIVVLRLYLGRVTIYLRHITNQIDSSILLRTHLVLYEQSRVPKKQSPCAAWQLTVQKTRIYHRVHV